MTSGDQSIFPEMHPCRTHATDDLAGRMPVFGLTKRELFAALALQGILSKSWGGAGDEAILARICTASADALIVELAKEKP